MKRTAIERFLKHSDVHIVPPCWIWTGYKDSDGYGNFRLDDKIIKAHRFAYENWNGPIPDGLFVCHKCDNPACVNPSHLFLGTQKDNMQDCAKKGRISKGEKHSRAKLTALDIIAIRNEYKPYSKEHSTCALAKKYGVVPNTIFDIIRNKIWKHIA